MTILDLFNPQFAFILWDVSPEVANGDFFGITIRYYGILFALGFFFGQLLLTRIFKIENKSDKDIEKISIYMLVATILGARLGHCFFYEPGYYLQNPLEIFKVWKGGLASHGAAVGILTAIYLYSKSKSDQSYLWVLDRIAILVALAGALIRTGNLMNSEIIGKPSSSPWAVEFVHGSREAIEQSFSPILESLEISKTNNDTLINGMAFSELRYQFKFKPYKLTEATIPEFLNHQLPSVLMQYQDSEENVRVIHQSLKADFKLNEDGGLQLTASLYAIPRHPAQVYEAISTFLLFLLLFSIWNKFKSQLPEGRTFGIFMTILFALRFGYEFLKENQVAFEDSLSLNMGQILSLPMIVIGLWVLWRSFKKSGSQV